MFVFLQLVQFVLCSFEIKSNERFCTVFLEAYSVRVLSGTICVIRFCGDESHFFEGVLKNANIRRTRFGL